ncbi:MAG: hypothetical protein QXQ20_08755 [Candidatus Nezhaarchaeales archaeon]
MPKLRKYFPRGSHPLAPFSVEIEALSISEALDELRKVVDYVTREASKEMVEKPRNPLTCANVKDLQGILVCTAFPGEPKAWSRSIVEKMSGASDPTCASCKKFKPR